MQPEHSKTFSAVSKESAYSSGLRAYFMKIYNYMAGGLALSSLTAWVGTMDPLFSLFYTMTLFLTSYFYREADSGLRIGASLNIHFLFFV